MRLLTVATTDYLHFVDVLFNSVRKVHPELILTVIVADCSKEMISPVKDALGSDVDVFCCADLGFNFLEDMRSYYLPLEFCSALKVLGLAYILKAENECLFLDPDMIVYDSLQESVIDKPGEIVLSCHSFSSFPKDDSNPNDLEIFTAGHLNGGILFCRQSIENTSIINWLVEKTKFQWFIFPEHGMYADQQWLSALPYFFRNQTTLILDRGVNVAYWNLHERPLYRLVAGGPIILNDREPLRLMHFSGFKIPSNGRLSLHGNRVFDTKTELILREIIYEYEQKLSSAQKKFFHLRGDLGFCSLPLAARLKLAKKRMDKINLINTKSVIKRTSQIFKVFLK